MENNKTSQNRPIGKVTINKRPVRIETPTAAQRPAGMANHTSVTPKAQSQTIGATTARSAVASRPVAATTSRPVAASTSTAVPVSQPATSQARPAAQQTRPVAPQTHPTTSAARPAASQSVPESQAKPARPITVAQDEPKPFIPEDLEDLEDLGTHRPAKKSKKSQRSQKLTSKYSPKVIITVVAIIVVAIITAAVIIFLMSRGEGGDSSGNGSGDDIIVAEPSAPTEQEERITAETLEKYVQVDVVGYQQVEGTDQEAVIVNVKNISDQVVSVAAEIVAMGKDGQVLDHSWIYVESIEPEQVQSFPTFTYSKLTPDELRSAEYKVYRAYSYGEIGTEEGEIIEEIVEDDGAAEEPIIEELPPDEPAPEESTDVGEPSEEESV